MHICFPTLNAPPFLLPRLLRSACIEFANICRTYVLREQTAAPPLHSLVDELEEALTLAAIYA